MAAKLQSNKRLVQKFYMSNNASMDLTVQLQQCNQGVIMCHTSLMLCMTSTTVLFLDVSHSFAFGLFVSSAAASDGRSTLVTSACPLCLQSAHSNNDAAVA